MEEDGLVERSEELNECSADDDGDVVSNEDLGDWEYVKASISRYVRAIFVSATSSSTTAASTS